MAETTFARINAYLADALAEEQAFADNLMRSSAAPHGGGDAFLAPLAEHARTQASRLQAVLEARGGSPSHAKRMLARALGASSLAPELLETGEQRRARRLGFALSALAAHSGMYEALQNAAGVARQDEVAGLAKEMMVEKRAQRDLLESSFAEWTAAVLAAEPAQASSSAVTDALDEAIATARSVESQVVAFAKAAEGEPAGALLQEYAQSTRARFEQMTRRLESLGKEPSLLKNFLSQVFHFVPKLAAAGHDPDEVLVQHLIATYALANAEWAALAMLREAAGLARDESTFALAAALQAEVSEVTPRVWAEIGPAAEVSMGTMPYASSQ